MIVTVMYPPRLPEGAVERLQAAGATEVHHVPYFETQELRNARQLGQLTDELEATAPPVDDAGWANLLESEAVMALDLPVGLVERSERLAWVQAIGAGVGQLGPARLGEAGIVLTNAAGVASASIAEFVIGRVLEVIKNIRTLEVQQAEKRWEMCLGGLLKGRTMGIVGLGAIGRDTARRARAFGVEVLATRRSARPGDTDPDVDELWPADALDDILGRCDVVVLCAPSTAETQRLFDAGRIARMKPGSILVNVARGALVDEPALIGALEAGHLGAAVLDVQDNEPMSADDPLWDAPNLYLSPHSSTSTEGYDDALIDLFALNIARRVGDEPMHNLVDTSIGY
ncbi:MAG: D-2-hydroxyacid dehydrogenase [Acidimicrobiales bacterium]|nr:D-2-hydroxyacid dehydrogenase [Acidimicrobiales bacterium]